jgi:hypothetical protein
VTRTGAPSLPYLAQIASRDAQVRRMLTPCGTCEDVARHRR